MSARLILGRSVLVLCSLLPGLPCCAKTAAPPKHRPVRVLLAASAPTREYQYVLRLLQALQEEKQVTLTRYLQPRPGWDDEKIRQAARQEDQRLAFFPSRLAALEDEPTGKRAESLSSYDVLIAFDLDWRRLPEESLKLLPKWIEERGGGLILVAGPIHTPALAHPTDPARLRPIAEVCPVVLADRWPQGKEIDAQLPKRLAFSRAAQSAPFLKLDTAGTGALAGWQEFFGEERAKEASQGFYSALPVQKVKEQATVLATLSLPRSGGEVPYLVTRSLGKGRVVYLGSGELWRLRQFRVAFHERFWKELVHYAVP